MKASIYNEDQYTRLGCVVNILSQSQQYCQRSALEIRLLTEHAIAHDQIEFYYNQSYPVGYIAWALLSEEVIGKLLYYNQNLHFSEWFEGEYPWIMDCCFIDKKNNEFMIDFLADIFIKYDFVYWSDNIQNSNLVYKLNIKSKRLSYISAEKLMYLLSKHSGTR